MTQLALAVDADDELWTLDALPTPEAPYVEVENELIEVRSRFPSSYYTLTGETLPPKIRVRRGIAGTTKASHVQGSTLTPNYGLGSGEGGGAIAVDNTVDAPVEATGIVAAGATFDGTVATLRGKDFYAQDTDPGAVGTGSVWKDTGAPPYLWWERNAADDGWDASVRITTDAAGVADASSQTTATSVDGGASAGLIATSTGSGLADASISADTQSGIALAYQSATTVDDEADAHAAATATGTGTADTSATSTTVSGDATSGIKAIRDAVEASVLVDSTGANARVIATASDITLTATDDIDLTADGDISLNPLGEVVIGGDLRVGTVIVLMENIPTVDPTLAGQLWNDTGTLKVSTG